MSSIEPLGVGIFVQSEQADALVERLDVALGVESLSTLLEGGVQDLFQTRVDKRFKDEGDSASGKWDPLAERTIEDRIALGYPGEHPINVRSGMLRSYVGGPGALSSEGLDSVSWTWPGTAPHDDIEFYKFMTAQGGNWAGAPARPVVAMDVLDLEEVLTLLEQHILDTVASAGAGGILSLLSGNP